MKRTVAAGSCLLAEPLAKCGCRTSLNLSSVAENMYEIKDLLNSTLHRWHAGYDGSTYLGADAVEGPYKWLDGATGEQLDNEMQAEVSLLALELVATPGRAGAMSTGAAITDPLFWMIHPIFEKAWQLLRLAPRYAHYDMTWRNGSCYGSSLHDHQAFTGVLGGEPGHYYTNAELIDLLDPTTVPYIYTGFTQWGNCHWAPECPDCGKHITDDGGEGGATTRDARAASVLVGDGGAA